MVILTLKQFIYKKSWHGSHKKLWNPNPGPFSDTYCQSIQLLDSTAHQVIPPQSAEGPHAPDGIPGAPEDAAVCPELRPQEGRRRARGEEWAGLRNRRHRGRNRVRQDGLHGDLMPVVDRTVTHSSPSLTRGERSGPWRLPRLPSSDWRGVVAAVIPAPSPGGEGGKGTPIIPPARLPAGQWACRGHKGGLGPNSLQCQRLCLCARVPRCSQTLPAGTHTLRFVPLINGKVYGAHYQLWKRTGVALEDAKSFLRD